MNLPKFALDHKAVVLVTTSVLIALGVLVFICLFVVRFLP